MPLFDELVRRRIAHVAATPPVAGWLLTEVLTTLLPEFGAPSRMGYATFAAAAVNLGWQEPCAQPQYTDIVADPRVEEAMRQWQSEEDAMPARIKAFLLTLDMST